MSLEFKSHQAVPDPGMTSDLPAGLGDEVVISADKAWNGYGVGSHEDDCLPSAGIISMHCHGQFHVAMGTKVRTWCVLGKQATT